ncbi:hypothetical protein GGQ95_002694 [Anoxybacillus rupiensis]|nr:hypothetical protein [Anoxybacillus rupiensis]
MFILDEMHLAKDAFLQDITILFNFHMDSTNLFVLILAGLPHLQAKLRLNQHRPLHQRIIMRYQMGPLDKEEVVGYRTPPETGGSETPDFYPGCLGGDRPAVAGVAADHQPPRHHLLLYGAQLKKHMIDEDIVLMAAEEIGY